MKGTTNWSPPLFSCSTKLSKEMLPGPYFYLLACFCSAHSVLAVLEVSYRSVLASPLKISPCAYTRTSYVWGQWKQKPGFIGLLPKRQNQLIPGDCLRAVCSLGTLPSLVGVSRNPDSLFSCICIEEKVFSKTLMLSFSVTWSLHIIEEASYWFPGNSACCILFLLLLFFKVCIHYSDSKESEQVAQSLVTATFSLPSCIWGIETPTKFLPCGMTGCLTLSVQGRAVLAASRLEVALLQVTKE